METPSGSTVYRTFSGSPIISNDITTFKANLERLMSLSQTKKPEITSKNQLSDNEEIFRATLVQ